MGSPSGRSVEQLHINMPFQVLFHHPFFPSSSDSLVFDLVSARSPFFLNSPRHPRAARCPSKFWCLAHARHISASPVCPMEVTQRSLSVKPMPLSNSTSTCCQSSSASLVLDLVSTRSTALASLGRVFASSSADASPSSYGGSAERSSVVTSW